MELADVLDSKSSGSDTVRVRPPLPAPNNEGQVLPVLCCFCTLNKRHWDKGRDMDKNRFEKQIRFILEADKEKNIFRQTHIGGNTRRENDAEHAWHMAMMIYLLKEYANEEIDVAKAMMMALIHDIVEIDAGDTYCYDAGSLETQKEREEKAAERIFGLLPEEQKNELQSLFYEFENYSTPEARFARAMDNFQPLILINSNNGDDWKKRGICKSQVVNRHSKTALGSEEIGKYSMKIIEENTRNGNLKDI